MKIGQKFNTLTLKEYFFYIANHKRYSDFNVLGLYRSIIENNKLTVVEKIEVREYAHSHFHKSFDFLQLKDPVTFFEVSTIGQELTVADANQIWEDIKANQQKILADKKIKHRSFGTYSRHYCAQEGGCPYNGLMVRQNTWLAECKIYFQSDRNRYGAKYKSESNKRDRKNERNSVSQSILLGE